MIAIKSYNTINIYVDEKYLLRHNLLHPLAINLLTLSDMCRREERRQKTLKLLLKSRMNIHQYLSGFSILWWEIKGAANKVRNFPVRL